MPRAARTAWCRFRPARWNCCVSTGASAVRRFLQHTPPPGFHRLRYYGFLAPGGRATLRALLAVLLDQTVPLADLIASLREPSLTRPTARCRVCGGGQFRIFGFLPCTGRPAVRGPP
jgi:hypothetical protein